LSSVFPWGFSVILSSEQARLIPGPVRVLLAQLELISHGSTASWNPAGGHSEPSPLPFGESAPPHLVLRERYLEADDDAGRSRAVEAMRRELKHARGYVDRSHVVGETRHEETLRIIKEGEGFTPAEVSLRFRCTPTRVRAVRLATGRDAEAGRLIEGENPNPGDDVEAAKRAAVRMKQHGMSIRLIGMELGKPKSTISDWLRDAA
jgi:hypothetical protein